MRKLESNETYCLIDADLKAELRLTFEALASALEHSGDSTNLSLRTHDHEILQARMTVADNLTARKIPSAFIDLSHREVKAARQKLEFKVQNFRAKSKTSIGKSGDTSLSPQELARNPDLITKEEEKSFEDDINTLDKGIYSASRELAVLNQQVALHHDEHQSIEDIIKGRAEFAARELSKGHALDEQGQKIARSPDEIRRKLASRSSTVSGASTFAAKDLDGPPVAEEPTKTSSRRRSIAQSPEEIRKKIQEGQTSTAGKAVFGAKDIEPLPEVGSKKEEEKKTTSVKTTSVKTAGKAVFESKDLSDPKS